MSYYSYRYFSGANVTVELGEDDLYECAGISFMVNESNQPVYGYASTLYDGVIPGRRVIQGSFVVNFASEDIDNIRSIRELGESFIKNIPLFNIKINYGLGNQSKSNYLLSDCFLISQGQTIQISENVILEEFSFIARDIKEEAAIIESNNIEAPVTETPPVAAPALNIDNIKYRYILNYNLNPEGVFKTEYRYIYQKTINTLDNSPDSTMNYELAYGNKILSKHLLELYTANETQGVWTSLNDILTRDKYPDEFLNLAFSIANSWNSNSLFDNSITHSDSRDLLSQLLNTGTLIKE